MEHEALPTPATAAPSEARPAPPALRIERFIGRLAGAYRRVREAPGPGGLEREALDRQLAALTLATAAIRYARARTTDATWPPQVAVLGPTQTGKSTVVNLLLGRSATQVSPLAGFTVHPSAFWLTPLATPDAAWADALFPGWARRTPEELSREELGAFSLCPVPPLAGESLFDDGHALPPCVLWDTPDFDSLAARQYERGVLEVAAVADVYLLVLSREKYSDLSVWRLLALLEALRRPLVICLNKVTPESEAVVVRSLRERLAERGRAWGDVPIVTLPYDPDLATGQWGRRADLAQGVRAALVEPLAKSSAAGRAAGVRGLLRQHWDDWLAPVQAEHEAVAQWRGLVAEAAERFLEAYRRDYLDHPERYDSFRKAAVELLNLLELPRIGGVVAQARKVVTWPARKLLAAGRSWWRTRHPGGPSAHGLGAEAGVLIDALDAMLTQLQRDVARRYASADGGTAVWRALAEKLAADDTRLRGAFEAMIRAHHQEVQREIRAAAGQLFEALQQHPARLNALRTARATIDVGYLLLAIKTGGLSGLDVIWAPATFALTSLLMEGATGLEMGHVARGLKARQWEAVKGQLVGQRLVGELNSVTEGLAGPGLLAIEHAEALEAERALAVWEAEDE